MCIAIVDPGVDDDLAFGVVAVEESETATDFGASPVSVFGAHGIAETVFGAAWLGWNHLEAPTGIADRIALMFAFPGSPCCLEALGGGMEFLKSDRRNSREIAGSTLFVGSQRYWSPDLTLGIMFPDLVASFHGSRVKPVMRPALSGSNVFQKSKTPQLLVFFVVRGTVRPDDQLRTVPIERQLLSTAKPSAWRNRWEG